MMSCSSNVPRKDVKQTYVMKETVDILQAVKYPKISIIQQMNYEKRINIERINESN